MKKKIFLYSLALAASMPVAAQETYENAKLTSSELNGTARYVGMGGAMEALGADISTIATNPAGLGLFPVLMVLIKPMLALIKLVVYILCVQVLKTI